MSAQRLELAAAMQLDLVGSTGVFTSGSERHRERFRQHMQVARAKAEVAGRDLWQLPPSRGDEIRQCFASPSEAAECAKLLLMHFTPEAHSAIGLPHMPPRVALHWGRVDAPGGFAEGEAFLEVAAIEREVEPGEVWATETFAAIYENDRAPGIRFDYIGKHSFEKLQGQRGIYRLVVDETVSPRPTSGRRDPVDTAIEILRSGSDAEREDALIALGHLHSRRSTMALLDVANDISGSARHRHAALRSLAQLADSDASGGLRLLLPKVDDAPTRRLVVHALGAIKDSDNVGELLTVAEVSTEPIEVRETALLGLHGTPPGREAGRIGAVLSKLLIDPNVDVVRAAAVAASMAPATDGPLRARLVECLANRSLPEEVRQAAFESLPATEDLEPSVKDIAQDITQPSSLRRVVLDCLMEIAGEDLRRLEEVSQNTVDPLRTYALIGLSQVHGTAPRPVPRRTVVESAQARILRLRLPA